MSNSEFIAKKKKRLGQEKKKTVQLVGGVCAVIGAHMTHICTHICIYNRTYAVGTAHVRHTAAHVQIFANLFHGGRRGTGLTGLVATPQNIISRRHLTNSISIIFSRCAVFFFQPFLDPVVFRNIFFCFRTRQEISAVLPAMSCTLPIATSRSATPRKTNAVQERRTKNKNKNK